MKVEAIEALEHDARIPEPYQSRQAAPEEIVEPQPAELYRPPEQLRRTAPEAFQQLEESLRRLWEANNDWVGERCVEVEAYYAATGQHLDLKQRLRESYAQYF